MEEKEAQSKKPEDSDFQQQRLRAWQPLLTPKWVILTFFIIGVVFLPIGIAILVASRDVVEYSQRYDNTQLLIDNGCNNTVSSWELRSKGSLDDGSNNMKRDEKCTTWIDFPISKDMKQPVFVYYKLTNFYQNHRRYVKSRSDIQLRGESPGVASDTSYCDPLNSYISNGMGINGTLKDRSIYPCGLIANSVFNDTFDGAVYPVGVSPQGSTGFDGSATILGYGGWDLRNPSSDVPSSKQTNTTWQKAGISWKSDRDNKFKYINTTDMKDTVTNIGPGGFLLPRVDDEDFIVWMRTAGLPTFKKLYRVVHRDLKAGELVRIKISSVYPVGDFSGEKHVVLSTTSWLGGKNDFLGVAYIVVGSICLFLAAAFLVKHCISPRPLGDMKYFNWPGQTPIRAQAVPRTGQ